MQLKCKVDNTNIIQTRMEQRPEFFKLDEIDRKVLFWLIDHVQLGTVKSWIEFIAEDYKQNRSVEIDVEKLLNEIKNS